MVGFKYIKNVSTLKLDQEKCTGCQMCTIVCPHRIFVMNLRKAMIVDRDACMECGACARNCPAEAIFVNAGVGCAAAVITSKLKGTELTCGCDCCCAKEESCC